MVRETKNKNWYIWVPFVSKIIAIPFALSIFLLMPIFISLCILILFLLFLEGGTWLYF